MYHPAAALHQGSLRQVIEDDFKKLPELLKQMGNTPQAEKPARQTPKDEPKQMSMF
jgi:DNA polymerase